MQNKIIHDPMNVRYLSSNKNEYFLMVEFTDFGIAILSTFAIFPIIRFESKLEKLDFKI